VGEWCRQNRVYQELILHTVAGNYESALVDRTAELEATLLLEGTPIIGFK